MYVYSIIYVVRSKLSIVGRLICHQAIPLTGTQCPLRLSTPDQVQTAAAANAGGVTVWMYHLTMQRSVKAVLLPGSRA